jgi:hypothetical protein
MSDMPAGATLAMAKAWLSDRLDKGAHCPCCGQFARIYRRQINAAMARTIIAMYHHDAHDFMHLPTVAGYGGDAAKLVYWGLIEEEALIRADGGRAGWWRLTSDGRAYVLGQLKVPQYAAVYDGRLLPDSPHGPPRDIRDALGKRFDYSELMAA